MQSKYDKSRHVLVDQSELSKPLRIHYTDDYNYQCNLKIYHDHIASLRELPCVPGSIWEEDRIYEEGRDYKIGGCLIDDCDCDTLTEQQKYCSKRVLTAIPIPKEDDLWLNVVSEVARYYNGTEDHHVRFVDVDVYAPDIIKTLKEQGYQITKKTV
jgi:hypothetical protein